VSLAMITLVSTFICFALKELLFLRSETMIEECQQTCTYVYSDVYTIAFMIMHASLSEVQQQSN
jgi:hypothetical protein